jgi:hypothetical protein
MAFPYIQSKKYKDHKQDEKKKKDILWQQEEKTYTYRVKI